MVDYRAKYITKRGGRWYYSKPFKGTKALRAWMRERNKKRGYPHGETVIQSRKNKWYDWKDTKYSM